MNSSDNGGSALLRVYQREASLGVKTLRKILWEKSWILDENCDEKLNNYPKSKTQINSFVFNKNAAKLELSLKNETIYYFSSVKYNIWKLSVMLSYSDFISLILNLVLFIQMSKMIALSYKHMNCFCFESIYKVNSNENKLIEYT